MTIIAVKKHNKYIEIASDSLMTYGEQKFGNFRKIVKVNDIIVGVAGDGDSLSLISIFIKNNKPKKNNVESMIEYLSKFHVWSREKVPERKVENYFIIISKGKIFRLINFYCEEIKTYGAIGSGMETALGAMHLGHDVKKAVTVACKVNIHCGLPMYYHKIKI